MVAVAPESAESAATPATRAEAILEGATLRLKLARPLSRQLRVYAFDPSAGMRLETLATNEAVLDVVWEDDLAPGPVGEYLEVLDIDPASNCAYAPVDLNHPYILAQRGLEPSDANPQFHQQMVYAVAMRTIQTFERALGRSSFWAERRSVVDGEHGWRFVRRLRIYPHALREANAYYSPDRCALLFGYFNAAQDDPGDNLPGGLVFTCLSHDIVAHETAHALLDGIHPRFKEQTNRDMVAFHEAFADIIALFQHFAMPEALRDQLAQARGDLAMADLLGSLAGQFGQARGRRGALRSYVSTFDEVARVWKRREPHRSDYADAPNAHARGAVLVGAVFDAFLQIFRRRTEDLKRLATGGTGILPQGALPADLVERMSQEAAKVAQRVLDICIRALDYCPPVDLTFGEYLRALVTADRDLVPHDPHDYRVAFISAFRARGIYPAEVSNLSASGLLWRRPDVDLKPIEAALNDLSPDAWTLHSDRLQAYRWANAASAELRRALLQVDEAALRDIGLYRTERERVVEIGGVKGEVSKLEMHVRAARRVGPDGNVLRDTVIEITQRWKPNGSDGFYRGGCTLICDGETRAVRYVIRKQLAHKERMMAQDDYQTGQAFRDPAANYFAVGHQQPEPFALLHRS
jgi:hypothetical protein